MTKPEELCALLSQGWQTVPDLMAKFGWKPHTLRGAISRLALNHIKVERRRVDGVTSYRVAEGTAA